MFYYCFSIREALVMEMSGLAKLVATRPGSGWHQSGLALATKYGRAKLSINGQHCTTHQTSFSKFAVLKQACVSIITNSKLPSVK